MTTAASRLRRAWDGYFFSPAAPTDLCVGRAVFYSLAFLYYVNQDFSEWGTVGAEFWMPTAFFSTFRIPLLTPAGITIVENVWKVSLALAAVGLWTRWATVVAFAGGFYLLGLPHNFGQTQHFDTFIVLVFGILAAEMRGRWTPCAAPHVPRHRRCRPRLPVRSTAGPSGRSGSPPR
jgi:hypothetical protein